MSAIQRILAVLATTALCACNPETSAPQPGEPSPQTFELGIGSSRLEVEVATTAETREIGLMNRTGMAKNHGMIFVFPANAQMCFWMKNTLIPLSVAFLNEDGKILNIEDMAPETEDSHCSAGSKSGLVHPTRNQAGRYR